MPELTASMNPSLAEGLAATASWARAEEDFWSAELERLEPQYLTSRPETVLIQTGSLLLLPVAVQRRLLRRGIERVRGSLRSIDFRHIEGVRTLMADREGSGRIQLPGLDVYRSFDWLRLTPIGFDARIERDFEIPLLVPGNTEDIDRHLSLVVELSDRTRVYNDEVDGLDWERVCRFAEAAKLAAQAILTIPASVSHRAGLQERRSRRCFRSTVFPSGNGAPGRLLPLGIRSSGPVDLGRQASLPLVRKAGEF